MSEAVLKHTLVVRRPDTGIATALVAGSQVPEWASDLVHDDDLEAPAKESPEKKAPAKKAAASKSDNN